MQDAAQREVKYVRVRERERHVVENNDVMAVLTAILGKQQEQMSAMEGNQRKLEETSVPEKTTSKLSCSN